MEPYQQPSSGINGLFGLRGKVEYRSRFSTKLAYI